MLEPIVTRARGYEALTDGSFLEVRRMNGVVVGEGRLDLVQGSFRVDDYTGEVDEDVHHAVEELLREHADDIVIRVIARERSGMLS